MIAFDPISHTYIRNDIEYQSVTTWMKQFIPEFEKEKIATICANNEGVEVEEMLKRWESKGRMARDYGNAVHNAIEHYEKYGERSKTPHLDQVIDEYLKVRSDNVMHSEIIVYDDDDLTAGTIDLIEVVGKGKVKLIDIKTGTGFKKAKGKLLGKFSDLPNNDISKFRLQLSKYKQMLEKMKKVKVIGLEVWQLDESFKIIELEPVEL